MGPAIQKLQDSDYFSAKILSAYTDKKRGCTVIERTEMHHTKRERNATEGIRTTVTEQKQQEV